LRTFAGHARTGVCGACRSRVHSCCDGTESPPLSFRAHSLLRPRVWCAMLCCGVVRLGGPAKSQEVQEARPTATLRRVFDSAKSLRLASKAVKAVSDFTSSALFEPCSPANGPLSVTPKVAALLPGLPSAAQHKYTGRPTYLPEKADQPLLLLSAMVTARPLSSSAAIDVKPQGTATPADGAAAAHLKAPNRGSPMVRHLQFLRSLRCVLKRALEVLASTPGIFVVLQVRASAASACCTTPSTSPCSASGQMHLP
jgi:hypothetical protein